MTITSTVLTELARYQRASRQAAEQEDERLEHLQREVRATLAEVGIVKEEPGGILRLHVLSGFCLGGGRDVYPGDVLEAPGDLRLSDALAKIRTGLLRVAETPPQAAPIRDQVQTGDPKPETRARRRRGAGGKTP